MTLTLTDVFLLIIKTDCKLSTIVACCNIQLNILKRYQEIANSSIRDSKSLSLTQSFFVTLIRSHAYKKLQKNHSHFCLFHSYSEKKYFKNYYKTPKNANYSPHVDSLLNFNQKWNNIIDSCLIHFCQSDLLDLIVWHSSRLEKKHFMDTINSNVQKINQSHLLFLVRTKQRLSFFDWQYDLLLKNHNKIFITLGYVLYMLTKNLFLIQSDIISRELTIGSLMRIA